MTLKRTAIAAACAGTVLLLAACSTASDTTTASSAPAASTAAAASPQPSGSMAGPVGSEPAPTAVPSTETTNAENVAAAIMGMTSSDAEKYATDHGVQYRVGEVDGQPQPTTRDYRPDRVTVSLQDDIVIAATVG